MAAKDYPCPKCSKPNTTKQTTCKNCGADLEQVLDGSKHKEKVAGRSSTLILNFIIAVAILGIIIASAVPKAFSTIILPSPIAVARGVGSALSSTITNKHANYLITGTTPYSAYDVVADTQYGGGITATTGEPKDRQISAVTPTTIKLNYKDKVFEWDYIPLNVDTAAFIRETGDNWKAAKTGSTQNLIIILVVFILGIIIVVARRLHLKNHPFTPTSVTRADLNKAQKKIRNACIAGIVPGAFFLFIVIVSSTINTHFSILILAIAVSFGLPFGVYKGSTTCAIILFMWNICVIVFVLMLTYDIIRQGISSVYIGVGCVSFVLLYFTFEGIRGTFTNSYHKSIITNQYKSKVIRTRIVQFLEITFLVIIFLFIASEVTRYIFIFK